MKNWLKQSWQRTPLQVRKPLVFILGFTIVGAGIILLPLPGPGWLVIFAGFAILATEFEFAERVRDWVVIKLKSVIKWLKNFWRNTTKR